MSLLLSAHMMIKLVWDVYILHIEKMMKHIFWNYLIIKIKGLID